MAKKSELEVQEKYVYNREADKYVINLPHRVKPYVLSGYKMRAIRRALSGEITSAQTAADVCLKFKILEADFNAIKKIFGLGREAFPLTDEELAENGEQKSAETIVAEKQAYTLQIAERIQWKETQENANKWLAFQNGQLDPLSAILSDWTPPKSSKTIKAAPSRGLEKSLIVCLSDTHAGGFLHKEANLEGHEWNKDKFREFIAAYAAYIQEQFVLFKPAKIYLFSLGDILDGPRGTTEKGTALEQDCEREQQISLVYDELHIFIESLLSLGAPVEIHACQGNHDSLYHYAFFEMQKKMRPGTVIENHKTGIGLLTIYNTGFIISHGANDVIDSKIPNSDLKRESYIQNIILNNREKFDIARNFVAIQGDRHSRLMVEHDNFEFYVVGSPARSLYAKRLNMNSQPSQNCFIVGDRGVENVLNFLV